ncbi:hypothetical protein MES4922_120043 [Mesorhizobium ventifaucium]|uniref:Uncharacterized protein n=1 Tax=Mesorhizobium ventifaucium TaxID=666020 RepID=A0ABN8JAT8_9HYPH|nr:hypothetical protein MES4922_120043 [Mesorhizobium ventifaucium]
MRNAGLVRLLAHRHQCDILGMVEHETRRDSQLRRHILEPFDQQLRQRTLFHSAIPHFPRWQVTPPMVAMQQLELNWFKYSKWTFNLGHAALSWFRNLPERLEGDSGVCNLNGQGDNDGCYPSHPALPGHRNRTWTR